MLRPIIVTVQYLRSTIQRPTTIASLLALMALSFVSEVGAQNELRFEGVRVALQRYTDIVVDIDNPQLTEEQMDEVVEAITRERLISDRNISVNVGSKCFSTPVAINAFRRLAVKLAPSFGKCNVKVHVPAEIEGIQSLEKSISEWKGAWTIGIYLSPYGTLTHEMDLPLADEALAKLYKSLPNLELVSLPEFVGQKSLDAVFSSTKVDVLMLHNVTSRLSLAGIEKATKLHSIILPSVSDMNETVAHLEKTKIDHIAIREVSKDDIELIAGLRRLRVLTIYSPHVRTFENLKPLKDLVRFEVRIPMSESESLGEYQKLWDQFAANFPHGLKGDVQLYGE